MTFEHAIGEAIDVLDRRTKLRCKRAGLFAIVERGGQGLGRRNLDPQRRIPAAHGCDDPLGATVLTRYPIGNGEHPWRTNLPQPVSQPTDIVLRSSIGM